MRNYGRIGRWRVFFNMHESDNGIVSFRDHIIAAAAFNHRIRAISRFSCRNAILRLLCSITGKKIII